MKTRTVVLTALLGLGILGSSFAYGQVPTLSLKDSIPVAEAALAKAGVDLADYFLFSVVFTNSGKGEHWYYTFRPKEPSEYDQIYVRVYMSGETELSGGEFSQTAY